MENYEHIREYTIDFCDVDFKDELMPSVLLKRFEEIACSSAEELGYGYGYLLNHGLAFMVTDIKAVFVRPVSLSEKILFSTWPTPPNRYAFGREFKAYDDKMVPVLYGTSRWALLDFNTKRLVPASTLSEADYSDGTKYSETKSYAFPEGKIPKIEPQEGEKKYEVKIGYSDYDHNGHTNNTRYADFCFNCFTVEELKGRKLSYFAVSFLKQSFEGETLSFYRADRENASFVSAYDPNGDCVVKSEIRFV